MQVNRRAGLIVLLMLVWMGRAATAQVPSRRSDEDVEKLFDEVEAARDDFDDHLDDDVKDAIIRSPRGEVKISAFLDDLEDNVEKLDDRFSHEYSASREAALVLEQGSALQLYFDRHDRRMKGLSEFDRFAATLARLAEVYGVSFPLRSDDTPRRYNDAEVVDLATRIATEADALEDRVDDDDLLDDATERSAKSLLDRLEQAAKDVADRVRDRKPASAEARVAVDLGRDIDQALMLRRRENETTDAWTRLRNDLDTLRHAFGAPASF